MNKLLILIFSLVFCNCSLNKKIVSKSEGNDIIGVWYQTKTIIANSSNHMATANKWNFDIDECRILLSPIRKYRYNLTNDHLRLYPIKGNEYVEWEKKLFFDEKIRVNKTDTTMIWSIIPDTLMITFKRNL